MTHDATSHQIAVVVAAALSAVACGSESDYDRFKAALDANSSCQELFDIRNAISPRSPVLEQVNQDLGRVGCLSSSSARQEPRQGGTDLYSINYKASYSVCSRDPNKTFQQAGTQDPAKAAAWLSEGTKAGEAYSGSYDGCLDGLNGKESKFTQ